MKGIYSSKLLVNENGKIIVHPRFCQYLKTLKKKKIEFILGSTDYLEIVLRSILRYIIIIIFMMSQVIKGEMKKKKKDKNPVKRKNGKEKKTDS